MSGIRWLSRAFQLLDDTGTPAAGAKVYFYLTGTSTLAETYRDIDLLIENDNPVVFDSSGRQPYDVFLDVAVTYRIVYKKSDDTTLAPDDDPVAGSDTSASIAAHNADPNAHLDATDSQRGMVELANPAEGQALTDTQRALTPGVLATITATSTRAGISERATGAETETGTDNTRHTTPLGIQSLQATAAEIVANAAADTHFMGINAFAQNISTGTDGYAKLPGGLTFKWGQFTPSGASSQTITFSVASGGAFSTACYHVSVSGGTTDSQDDNPNFAVPSSYLAASFDIYNDRGTTVLCSYFAIGK